MFINNLRYGKFIQYPVSQKEKELIFISNYKIFNFSYNLKNWKGFYFLFKINIQENCTISCVSIKTSLTSWQDSFFVIFESVSEVCTVFKVTSIFFISYQLYFIL